MKKIEAIEVYQKIMQGIEDYKNGNVIDGTSLMDELFEKNGK